MSLYVVNVIFHSETSYCIVVANFSFYMCKQILTCVIIVIFMISSVVSTVAGQGI